MNSDPYTSHPVRATLDAILAQRQSPNFGITPILDNPEIALQRDRIFAVADLFRNALKTIPTALASISLLNQMQPHWNAVLGELNLFQDDRNLGRLSSAASYIDQTQPMLSAFLLGSGGDAKNAALPAIMEQQTKYAQETVNNFSKMRDVSLNELESLGMRASQIDRQLQSAAEALMQHKVDAENAITKLETVFMEHEGQRNERAQNVINVFRGDLQNLENEAKSFNETHLKYLQDKKDEAARLVELVGTIGATGNYQKIANAEGRQANTWRWITLAFFAAGVVLAVCTFAKHWNAEINTESALSILVKLLYAVVITTPAWYAAKESARHRTLADRARQVELELASIGPFIELMPEEKKVEIREHLAKLYFGRTVESHNVDALLDGKTIRKLLVELVKSSKAGAKESVDTK